MEIRLLGPLEVLGDAGPVSLGGPKQRSVLAMLALSVNRVVSAERLIHGIWGEEASDRAGATLQVYVSNLRKALNDAVPGVAGADLIIGQRPGYVLRVDPVTVDLERFDGLVAQARKDLLDGQPQPAAEALHEALDCWRGPALADLELEPFARPETVRLAQARLGALEERFDADLALGRHAELVAEIEPLAAQNPLRERLWGQLIVALYRSGRQADALATYARARDLLVDELGIDPGPALRDLERAILAQDLDIPTPVSRTTTAPAPVRIPSPPNPLVGRAGDIDELAGHLRRGDTRLVTLTGPGGIGKTRLSLALAAAVADTFTGGVYVVGLSALERPELVLPAIAQALGVAEPGIDAVCDVLRDRHTLLVLDNLEQVIDAATDVAVLLAAARRLHVVVTSRTPLHVDGELEHPVGGLPVPPASAAGRNDLDATAASDSVALFVARARSVRNEFALTPGNVDAVVDICRRLDGVPLAIELAAARSRLLSVEAIRSRLDDSLRLLTGDRRDAPARQRTLRATIAWSVDSLDDDARRVLGRLALFTDGFFLATAAARCSAHVEDELADLVDASLLRVRDVAGEPRFQMLEVVRQYAAECLGQPPSLAEVAAVVEHVVELAGAAAAGIDGPDGVALLDRLAADQALLRWAMDAAVDAGDVVAAARIATSLVPYWTARGGTTEGRERIRSLLARDDLPLEQRAAALLAAGRLAYQQTDVPAASAALTAATATGALGGDDAGLAACLLAAVSVMSGDVATGVAAGEQARADAAAGGHYAPHVMALSVLAIGAAMSGDAAGERRLYEQRLSLARRRGDQIRTADTLTVLAEIAFDDGELDRAATLVKEAFSIADRCSRPESRDALIMLGRIAVAERDVERADELLDEAMHRAVDVGQSVALALCVRVHAAAATLRGEWERAAILFGAATALHDSAVPAGVLVEQDLAHSLAECRERLGEVDVDRCLAAGAELDREQVVELALRLTPAAVR